VTRELVCTPPAVAAPRAGAAGHSAYCASKAGLLGLSRCTAPEGAAIGITCVTLSPTWIETEMLRTSAAEMATQNESSLGEAIASIAKANPHKRLVQVDEIASLGAYC
jgi:NAD(P)-dependent dehydrogenase (short-subunit alcohol dehydrogenase family)